MLSPLSPPSSTLTSFPKPESLDRYPLPLQSSSLIRPAPALAQREDFNDPHFRHNLSDITASLLHSLYAARQSRHSSLSAAPTKRREAPATPPSSPDLDHCPSAPPAASIPSPAGIPDTLRAATSPLASHPTVRSSPHILPLALYLSNRVLSLPHLPECFEEHPERLLIATVMVAEAQVSDRQTSTRAWCNLVGMGGGQGRQVEDRMVGAKDVAGWKREVLKALGWGVWVKVEDYVGWLRAVKEVLGTAL